MNSNNCVLPEEEDSFTADSLGIKYRGPVLEGLVTPVDDLLGSTTRANPLDPFDVEPETWGS